MYPTRALPRLDLPGHRLRQRDRAAGMGDRLRASVPRPATIRVAHAWRAPPGVHAALHIREARGGGTTLAVPPGCWCGTISHASPSQERACLGLIAQIA